MSTPQPARDLVRVLVADDQALIRTGFATILDAQEGLEVVGEAGDGGAAIDLARRLRPDVVVMDIRMPVLDGIEATRVLAGPYVLDPVKVLVVTTFNLDVYVYDALRAGASGFLLKDARPAELIAAVRTVAAGDALLAPAVTRALIGRHATRLRTPVPEGSPGTGSLTPREVEVLRLVAVGRSNAEIASDLFLSYETVKTHVSRILTKLGLRDRVQAVVHAYRTGLISTDT
ncbi:response regulator [Kineococcus rubinsiae]|uniref:response regulator n=1 Tax=Kineococcus rubinsiae TaxID=2609562 RepID=UPI0014304C04|nr:response regulator transcription factor [Kineococcus rubinsiae]NIZ90366.1 response regulator transcription factor [Kineococcus rubinsiae]